jgi:hypothetical protein
VLAASELVTIKGDLVRKHIICRALLSRMKLMPQDSTIALLCVCGRMTRALDEVSTLFANPMFSSLHYSVTRDQSNS